MPRLNVFLVWTPSITKITIQHLNNCRIVVRYGVGVGFGFDKIDTTAPSEAGIAFSSNPEYGPEHVADTAMAILLGLRGLLTKDLDIVEESLRNGQLAAVGFDVLPKGLPENIVYSPRGNEMRIGYVAD